MSHDVAQQLLQAFQVFVTVSAILNNLKIKYIISTSLGKGSFLCGHDDPFFLHL